MGNQTLSFVTGRRDVREAKRDAGIKDFESLIHSHDTRGVDALAPAEIFEWSDRWLLFRVSQVH